MMSVLTLLTFFSGIAKAAPLTSVSVSPGNPTVGKTAVQFSPYRIDIVSPNDLMELDQVIVAFPTSNTDGQTSPPFGIASVVVDGLGKAYSGIFTCVPDQANNRVVLQRRSVTGDDALPGKVFSIALNNVVNSTVAGNYKLTVTVKRANVDYLDPTDSAAFRIFPDYAFTFLRFTLPTNGTTVQAAASIPVKVLVTDQYTNAIDLPTTVTLSSADAGMGDLFGSTLSKVTTTGVAEFTLGDNVNFHKAGTKQIKASTLDYLGSPISTNSANVIVLAGAPSANWTEIAANPATVAADGVASSTLTVTVRDEYQNPVQGATVTLNISGTENIVSTFPLSDANGVTTATLASTKAESKAVRPIANGTMSFFFVFVNFTGGAVDLAKCTLTATPSTGLVAGTDKSLVKVQAQDKFGNPVVGVAVQLLASGSNNAFDAATGVTDAAGYFQSLLGSTKAETKNLTAKVGGTLIGATATAQFVAGPVSTATSTITPSPVGATASGLSYIDFTVTALDANGNPVKDVTVAIASTGTGNILIQPAAMTGADGKAVGRMASTKAETKTVSATLNGAAMTATASVLYIAGPADPVLSTITAEPMGGTASGRVFSIITVTAVDVYGNPLQKAAVVVSATGTGNILTQPDVTGDNGVTTNSLASTNAGIKIVSATVNGVLLTNTASVTFIAGAVVPEKCLISASPATVPVTTNSTVTVTARDEFGNVVTNVLVELAAAGASTSWAPNPPTGNADTSGKFSAKLSSTVVGVKTVSAKVGGVAIPATATVTFTVGAADTQLSGIGVDKTTVPVSSGSEIATVTVLAKDAFGNVISGATVVLTATGDGNKITQPAVTGTNGLTTGTISSTKSGLHTIFATINGVTIFNTVSVNFVPGPISPANSTITANPTVLSVVGGAQSTITVTAQDEFGNGVSGATVVLAATGTGNALVQPAGTTGADGKAIGTLSSTVAGVKTVSAKINGVSLAQTVDVTFVPGEAANYRVTASDYGPAAGSAINIHAQLSDAQGNPVGAYGKVGRTVLWSTSNGGSLSAPATFTSDNGAADVVFTVSALSGTTHQVWARDGDNVSGATAIIIVDPDADSDGDGYSNRQEIYAGTNPLNPMSALKFAYINTDAGKEDLYLGFDSVAGVEYQVATSEDLSAWAIQQNITATSALTALVDAQAAKDFAKKYYRVSVYTNASALVAPVAVVSEAVGLQKVALKKGGNYMSVPLHNLASYRGLVDSATADTITFKGAPGWANNQFLPLDGYSQYMAIVRKDAPANASTNDAWDVSQGMGIIADTGAYYTSDIRNMFGGAFGTGEPANAIFADGKAAGFTHKVQWQTPAPVTLQGLKLYAAGDEQIAGQFGGPNLNNRREFASFVLKAKPAGATNWTVVYSYTPTHPYQLLDAKSFLLVDASVTPIIASEFAAEFVQYTSGTGFDGPRIIELDAITSSVVGEWWEVTGNTGNAITVKTRADDLSQLLAANAQVEIRHLASFQQVFGSDTLNSTQPLVLEKDSNGLGNGDTVRYADGIGFGAKAFYHNGAMASPGWYVDSIGPFGAATITLLPDQGLFVNRRNAALDVLVLGKVQSSRFAHYLKAGYTAVGTPFAVSAGIGSSGLLESGWAKDANNNASITEEDVVSLSDGSTFPFKISYVEGSGQTTGWYKNGALNNSITFDTGSVWFISKLAAGRWYQVAP